MRNINIIKKSLLGIMSAAAIAAGSVNPAFAADTQITSFTKEYQANIPNNAETSAYPSPKFFMVSSVIPRFLKYS